MAALSLSLVFLWKEQKFSLSRSRRRLTRVFFLLRIPMFNLFLCFFVLLIAFLSKEGRAKEGASPAGGKPEFPT